MKITYFFLAILFQLSVHSQDVVNYNGVVNVDSATKDQLFARARSWFNESFKSSKDVIQIADKETGELSGKGRTTLTAKYNMLGKRTYNYPTEFAVNVWVKDGKYKYEIKNFNVTTDGKGYDIGLLTTETDFPHKWPMTSKKTGNDIWNSLKQDAEITAKRLIASLNEAMKKGDSSNW